MVMIATMALSASAQTQVVSGKVTYAGDGEPLVGVSIVPIGSTTGTMTNADGEFSLKVPQKVKKLRVTYVGMLLRKYP